jgi:cleavage stimulation factor subunit 3
MSNIESLWKDYNTYEQSISLLVAKKMIDDKNKEFINARRATKELEIFQRTLLKNNPAVPPVGSAEERKQLEAWRKYIDWEKTNSLRIEDKLLLTKRVIFAYEQCLLVMGHHPELWYEAAQYLVRTAREVADAGDMNGGKKLGDDAADLYRRATSILMKNNPLIHFAYANFEEGRGKTEKCHSIYTKLTDLADQDPTLTFIQYMRFARRCEGIKSARQVFRLAREDGRIKARFMTHTMTQYHDSFL